MAVVATLNILTKVSTDGLTAGFSKASSSVQQFGDKVLGLGGVLKGMAAYFSARALTNWIGGSMKAIDEAARMANVLGMSTEAFTGLQDGMEDAGVGTEAFEKAIKNMRQAMAGAAGGEKAAAQAFASLGINVQDILNMPADEQLSRIADAFRAVGVNVHSTDAALQIFGSRAGMNLLPILGQGSQALQKFKDDAKAAGLVISDFDAAQVRQANLAMKDIKDAFTGIANTIAIQISPHLTAISKQFINAGEAGANAGKAVTKSFGGLDDVMKVLIGGLQFLDKTFMKLQQVPLGLQMSYANLTGNKDLMDEAAARVRELEGKIKNNEGSNWVADFEKELDKARQAAKDALANQIKPTDALANTQFNKLEPAAAMMRGSKEAYSASLKADRMMKGAADVQVAELKKVNKHLGDVDPILRDIRAGVRDKWGIVIKPAEL